METQTVLISGAGIAGPTLAYWLARAGLRPTLIEQAPSLRTGGYVIDFWGLGYDIADRMGLSGDLDRLGYHIQEMRIVDDNGERETGFGTNVFRALTGGRFVTAVRSCDRRRRAAFKSQKSGVRPAASVRAVVGLHRGRL